MTVKSQHDLGIMRQFIGNTIRDRIDTAKRTRRLKKLQNQPDDRPRAAVVFGAGALPGIGAAVALRAAKGGLKVYVTGRTQEKLDATVAEIRDAGGDAESLLVDVAEPEQIAAAFKRLVADGCRLDLIVDNVGTNRPKPFLDITPELMEKCWVNDCRSGFLIGQQAVEIMLEQADAGHGRGTVLFTGASASLRGKANFAAFAQAKAGLRMLAQSMAREYGPQGIHIAHVIIDGIVDGARLRGFAPQFVDAQGEDGALDPAAIAEAYWHVHQQHRSAWTHELDLRPYKETW